MYNHFSSKEELAWQLFINGWNEIGLEMRRRASVNRMSPRRCAR